MLTFPGSDGISPILTSKTYHSGNNANTASQLQSVQGSYDQLSLSPEPVGERRFQLELVSRLSNEVRTSSTPSSEIKELTEQVSSGEYHPDPMDTAAYMLLIGKDDVQ